MRAGWLHSRFQCRASGRTAFHELKGTPYSSELLCFGECVSAHFIQKGRKKMDLDWHSGVWVGRATNTDEHLVLTEAGVLRCRSVRRRDEEQRYDAQLLATVQGLPWDPRASSPLSRGSSSSGFPAPVPGASGGTEGKKTEAQRTMAGFHAACGPTPNCQACHGQRKFHHTVECNRRRQAWMDSMNAGGTIEGDSEAPPDQGPEEQQQERPPEPDEAMEEPRAPRHVPRQDLRQDPQSEEVQEASEVTWYDGVFLQRPQNEFGHQKESMKKNPLCQRQELRSLSPTSMTRASIQEKN